jgi:hypothetical protein
MKKTVVLVLSVLFVGTFLMCGCSGTKFKEYQGSAILQGNGGEVYTVDGIDFWHNGEPDRKYKVLGEIEEGHKHRIPLGPLSPASRLFSNPDAGEEAIAKAAEKNGGDAVIFVAKTPQTNTDSDTSTEDQSGHQRRQQYTLIVVKYVE